MCIISHPSFYVCLSGELCSNVVKTRISTKDDAAICCSKSDFITLYCLFQPKVHEHESSLICATWTTYSEFMSGIDVGWGVLLCSSSQFNLFSGFEVNAVYRTLTFFLSITDKLCLQGLSRTLCSQARLFQWREILTLNLSQFFNAQSIVESQFHVCLQAFLDPQKKPTEEWSIFPPCFVITDIQH